MGDTTRIYRFTITGELTIDDTTLKTAVLSFEHRDSADSPPLSPEQNLQRQTELMQKPPVEQMRTYLQARHFRVVGPAVIAQLDKDMPGIGYQIERVAVEELGQTGGWRPARPEDRAEDLTGRTFIFTGFTSPAGNVTEWTAHVVRHAVDPGDKHRALCGAPLSEVDEDRPWSADQRDDEDVCVECARRAS